MKRTWWPRTSNRTTKGSLGSAVKRTRRCISTSNGSKSRSSFAGSRASQRCPHVPSALTRLASSCPASVSAYSGPWGPSVRSIAPAKTRAWSRSERTVRDTRGMPLRMSLKRRLPHRISRTINRVQRPPSTSWARAMEQNCPYPAMPGNLSRRADRRGTESGPLAGALSGLADRPVDLLARKAGGRRVAAHDRLPALVRQHVVDVGKTAGRQLLDHIDDALRPAGAVHPHDLRRWRQPFRLVGPQPVHGMLGPGQTVGQRAGIEDRLARAVGADRIHR